MEKLSEEATKSAREEPRGAAAILDGRYLPPPQDGGGQQWVRTSVTVLAPPEQVYSSWRDVERAPRWHSRVSTVEKTGERTSRWSMTLGDRDLQWNSEILADEPGRRIAWATIDGDVDEAGEVIFEPALSGSGTVVTLLQQFRMGALEKLWETITDRNPKQSVVGSLHSFKALMESGEVPRTDGQPHGPRGAAAKAKRSLYGENHRKPSGQA